MKTINIEAKRQELVKAVQAASGPYQEMYKRDVELRKLRAAAEETLNKVNKDILAHQADPTYQEYTNAVGAAQSALNAFDRASKYLPLINALEPFGSLLAALPEAEQRRKTVSQLANVVPTLHDALVKCAPRDGNPAKVAKLTDARWSEVEAGMNQARALLS